MPETYWRRLLASETTLSHGPATGSISICAFNAARFSGPFRRIRHLRFTRACLLPEPGPCRRSASPGLRIDWDVPTEVRKSRGVLQPLFIGPVLSLRIKALGQAGRGRIKALPGQSVGRRTIRCRAGNQHRQARRLPASHCWAPSRGRSDRQLPTPPRAVFQ